MRPQNVAGVAGTGALIMAAGALADRAVFHPTSLTAPFIEQFLESIPESRWTVSRATKQTPVGDEIFSYVGQWEIEEPEVYPGISGDKGLVLKTKAAHHAISTLFDEPIDPKGKSLVVQYEVKLQKGLECGGAYIKLLTDQQDEGLRAGEDYTDKTPFTIMFGPDKCGSTNKVHFIFRHKNPLTGEWEEKHLKNPPAPKITKTTALYTLITNPDQTFEILINDESVRKGSLLEDFDPPVNPPKEIDDPEDFKPETWVDEAEIDDVTATKPDDWDEDAPIMITDTSAVKPEDWLEEEPETIPDPEAEKPEEWDDEEDGDWIPPMVPNPKCEDVSGCGPWTAPKIRNPAYKQGKWTVPKIPNPDYKGPWAPRKIANPAFFEDLHPSDFTKIGGVGIELWTMTEDILFDNLYIGHDAAQAKKFAEETYHVKKPIEKEAEGSNEEELEEPSSLVDKVQLKVYEFLHLATLDISQAVKQMPEVAAGLAAAVFTLLGMLLALFGFIGSAPTKVKQTSVKTKSVAPVAPAGEEEKKALDQAGVEVPAAEGSKKRVTRSTKE
ncbi:calnexin [Cryptococcus gattii Ru294]|uniref:Calnexin n=2 Tax=Cryptococcus gattii TaxID=37769 RepID=E6R6F9_CRYGW|nr:ER-associated protein catabolism-related protein, putative [Cryptococcus gattii WM276]ADV22283.1 ER-associated protein catabolism-related protein, putative [Cryptococcus gattii WM276]KIR56459.1 calnexin [Cryptococcus gattii Ru294]KIR78604.1 calnexin [Cryptococcus gattii EJB2]KJE04833.1 calnexin [Cryptococcus gattii NT-10]